MEMQLVADMKWIKNQNLPINVAFGNEHTNIFFCIKKPSRNLRANVFNFFDISVFNLNIGLASAVGAHQQRSRVLMHNYLPARMVESTLSLGVVYK